jgi:hypothetical protein
VAVLYYLTNHDRKTHCWTIRRGRTAQPDDAPSRAPARAVEAPAGSAIVFDASRSHAFVRRITASESRSLKIHFGRAGRPSIGNDTIVPRRLSDACSHSTRQWFRRPNLITQLTRQRQPRRSC